MSLGGLLTGCAREESIEEGLDAEVAGERLAGVWADRQNGIVAFKGVPFAAPPLGELRWKPPAAHEPRTGVQRAQEFGPRCAQSEAGQDLAGAIVDDLGGDTSQLPEAGASGEDCLYLNVWTPSISIDAKRPVMVWLHGGSNRWGGGDEPRYDGTALARRGVVVVTLNSRLGLFGYLAHRALSSESGRGSSGNYGLFDQIAALEWVQSNIEAFGGDPGRVTLFGGAAGAVDLFYLMISPLAEGLFHQAIAQSGSLSTEPRILAEEELRGVRLQEIFELQDSNDVLRDLRAIPAGRLLEVAASHLNEELDSSPVADGWAVPDFPGRLFANGAQHVVPLIVGSNADEWSTLGRYSQPVTAAGFNGWLASHWGALAGRARALYPAVGNEQIAASVARWQTDRWFTCPARFVADSMARASGPAFLYEFTRAIPEAAERSLGAYHGSEVAYAFDNLAAESWIPHQPEDQALAESMADYWVQFAATGDPNIEGRPEWPAYVPASRRHLELGDDLIAKGDLRSDACELWEARLRREFGLER